jgi:DNA transformation protein
MKQKSKTFRVMPDDSFKEYVLDQLSALPDVRARAMFGAHGLYQGAHFFAILDEGRLFFKTDGSNEADYTARGMEPFTYEQRGELRTMSYHEVPPEILEQPLELVAWARKAVQAAAAKTTRPVRAAKTKKAVRGRPR